MPRRRTAKARYAGRVRSRPRDRPGPAPFRRGRRAGARNDRAADRPRRAHAHTLTGLLYNERGWLPAIAQVLADVGGNRGSGGSVIRSGWLIAVTRKLTREPSMPASR